MDRPTVSVIMSLYSEPLEWLRESIESILKQDFKDFELIIINDNPKRIELEPFLAEYESNFYNIIKIIRNKDNVGLIESLNNGIDFARGKYIARMDADDISLSKRLFVQLEYLRANNYDLIGSNIEVVSEKKIKMYTSNKLLTDKFIDAVLLLGAVPLVHPTYLGKAEIFKKCKYNSQAIYAEDMELIAHARTLGYKIGNCPDILLKYRFNEGSITKSNAYISYNTALSVKQAFKLYKKTGRYNFVQLDSNFDKNKVIKFNNRQIFMNFAKGEIKNKNYLKGLIFLTKAMFSDLSFFRVIYINVMQYYYLKRDLNK